MRMTEVTLAQRRANVRAIAARRRAKKTCIRGHNNWGVRADGCRYCKTCLGDYSAKWRLREAVYLRAHPEDPRHGTITAYGYGCRCLRCAVSMSEYNEGKYKARVAG